MTYVYFHQLVPISSTLPEMWISYVNTTMSTKKDFCNFSWFDSCHSLFLFLTVLLLFVPFLHIVISRRSECFDIYIIYNIYFKITSVLGTVHPHLSAPRTAEWAPESPWHCGWPVQARHQVSPSSGESSSPLLSLSPNAWQFPPLWSGVVE